MGAGLSIDQLRGDFTDRDNNGKEYFTFSNSIFWPSDVNTLNFWAVAPATIKGIGQDGSGKS